MKLFHLAVAAASLGAAAHVHATSTAASTLSDLRIALVDLAPGDGVAPTLALDPRSFSLAQVGAVAPGASTYWSNPGDSAFGAAFVSGLFDGNGGSAAVSGDPFGDGATFAAEAVGRPSFVQGAVSATIDTQPSGETSFVLSAHTQVSFTGLATIAWNASAADASAHGDVELAFFENAADGSTLRVQDGLDAGYFPGDATALSGSSSREVAIRFANDSDQAVVLDYSVLAFADASEVDLPASTVPEPGGAALMLAGASLLAWAAHRRREGASRV